MQRMIVEPFADVRPEEDNNPVNLVFEARLSIGAALRRPARGWAAGIAQASW
jgi:hypothetical protein